MPNQGPNKSFRSILHQLCSQVLCGNKGHKQGYNFCKEVEKKGLSFLEGRQCAFLSLEFQGLNSIAVAQSIFVDTCAEWPKAGFQVPDPPLQGKDVNPDTELGWS